MLKRHTWNVSKTRFFAMILVVLLTAITLCSQHCAMAAIPAAVPSAEAHGCCPSQPPAAQPKACCADIVFHEPAPLRMEKLSAYELTDFAKNLLILTPNRFTGSIHAGEISSNPGHEPPLKPAASAPRQAHSIHAPPQA